MSLGSLTRVLSILIAYGMAFSFGAAYFKYAVDSLREQFAPDGIDAILTALQFWVILVTAFFSYDCVVKQVYMRIRLLKKQLINAKLKNRTQDDRNDFLKQTNEQINSKLSHMNCNVCRMLFAMSTCLFIPIAFFIAVGFVSLLFGLSHTTLLLLPLLIGMGLSTILLYKLRGRWRSRSH